MFTVDWKYSIQACSEWNINIKEKWTFKASYSNLNENEAFVASLDIVVFIYKLLANALYVNLEMGV